MADTLGTLVVRIAADIKELEAGLKDAQGLIRTSETATKSLATATDTLTRVYRDLAVAATAYKAFEYVKDATMLAARYETLGVSMKVVGQNAGYNAAQMEAAAQGMQSMGISMIESRQQAMRLVQAHIDLADSEKLARIAQDAAVIGNMNSSEAFATMIHGIQSGQTDVLRGIGLNVSMEQSYKIMAGTLHKNVDALTQNEKTQGVLNAVMLAGAGIAGTYEAAMDTAGKQINSMTRYTEDLKVLQGSVFNEILTVAVMAYTDHLKESNAEMRAMAANGELKAWGMELANVFVQVANAIDNMMTAAKMAGTWLASRNLVSDITEKYQVKIDAAPQGFGADSMARSNLIDQRDAEIKRAMAVLDESQVELAGRTDRFERAWDKRTQANAEKAAAELHATAQQSSSYNLAMLTLQKNRESGLLKETEFVKAVKTLWQANYGDNHHYVDTASTTKVPKSPKASEYDRLIKSINEKIAAERLDIETEGKLTAGQRDAIKIMDDIRTGALKFVAAKGLSVDAQKRELTALLESRLANEQEKIAQEGATKAVKEAIDYSKKITQAHNDATIAAQAYIDTVNKQNSREINGIGKGNDYRKNQSGINAIEDKQTTQRQGLEGDLRRGQIDRSQFDDYLAIVNDTYAKETEAYGARTEAIKAKQADWVNGATEAFANYQSAAQDVAGNTAAMFTNAFQGMTDGVSSSISQAILQGKSLEDSLRSVAMNVADAFITSFIKIQIQKLFIDKTAATGYAATMSMQAQAMVAMAGLNAFASTAAIPIVGPFLAPEAAAAAMALAEGFAATTSAMAFASVASAREGYDIPSGVNPMTQLHEEEMVLPRTIANPIRELVRDGGKSGGEKSGGGTITIINQMRSPIGKVTEQTTSNGERLIVIEEAATIAVNRINAAFGDPNSKTSRSVSRNFSLQRSRP